MERMKGARPVLSSLGSLRWGAHAARSFTISDSNLSMNYTRFAGKLWMQLWKLKNLTGW